MPYIEGPFSKAKLSDFLRIDEEQRAARRAEQIRRMRLLYDGDLYASAGVGSGKAGGVSNGYIDDERVMVFRDDEDVEIVGDDVGVYF